MMAKDILSLWLVHLEGVGVICSPVLQESRDLGGGGEKGEKISCIGTDKYQST